MKSKDDKNEDGSDQERKYFLRLKVLIFFVCTEIRYNLIFRIIPHLMPHFAPHFNRTYLFAVNKFHSYYQLLQFF